MAQNATDVAGAYRQKQTTLPETGFSGSAIKAAVVRSIEGMIQASRAADQRLDGLIEQVEKASQYPPPPPAEEEHGARRRLHSVS